MNRGEPAFDWAALVPLTVHPIQVAIVEAMEWIGQPLSATELRNLFDESKGHYLSLISYHMEQLVELGAIEKTSSRPVRGARETFYFFSKTMKKVS